MNTFARRLTGVLLTLALLVLPATVAQAEPLSGSLDRWTTSVTDLLADLFDGLMSIGAASESGDGDDAHQLDDGVDEPMPTADPSTRNGNKLTTTTRLGPGYDPLGAF